MLKSLLTICAYAVPLAAIILVTTYPNYKLLWAVNRFPGLKVSKTEFQTESGKLDAKQMVHRHFMKYGLYVPIEDIMAISKNRQEIGYKLVQQSCGYGRVFVWLPLRFNIPGMNPLIWEWCWKPKVRLK